MTLIYEQNVRLKRKVFNLHLKISIELEFFRIRVNNHKR